MELHVLLFKPFYSLPNCCISTDLSVAELSGDDAPGKSAPLDLAASPPPRAFVFHFEAATAVPMAGAEASFGVLDFAKVLSRAIRAYFVDKLLLISVFVTTPTTSETAADFESSITKRTSASCAFICRIAWCKSSSFCTMHLARCASVDAAVNSAADRSFPNVSRKLMSTGPHIACMVAEPVVPVQTKDSEQLSPVPSRPHSSCVTRTR